MYNLKYQVLPDYAKFVFCLEEDESMKNTEKQNVQNNEIIAGKEPNEFYTWCGIWYADEDNLKKYLTEQCRNWAYCEHDKDVKEDGTPKGRHIHFVATFDHRKSFKQVMRTTLFYRGDQNVMIEPPRAGIAPALEYLWHKNDATKYQYDKRKVVISSTQWFERYVGGNDETDNDRFMDDLLAPAHTFSIQAMGRKYGRDFIRNFKNYIEFRKYALAEQNGLYVPEQLAYDSRQWGDAQTMADGAKIARQNEEINNFLKG